MLDRYVAWFTQKPIKVSNKRRQAYQWLETLESRCLLTNNVLWIGGVDNRWENDANWQGGARPTGTDTAVFTVSALPGAPGNNGVNIEVLVDPGTASGFIANVGNIYIDGGPNNPLKLTLKVVQGATLNVGTLGGTLGNEGVITLSKGGQEVRLEIKSDGATTDAGIMESVIANKLVVVARGQGAKTDLGQVKVTGGWIETGTQLVFSRDTAAKNN